MIKAYLDDKDPDASLLVGADMRKINLSFKLLKVWQKNIKTIIVLNRGH